MSRMSPYELELQRQKRKSKSIKSNFDFSIARLAYNGKQKKCVNVNVKLLLATIGNEDLLTTAIAIKQQQ